MRFLKSLLRKRWLRWAALLIAALAATYFIAEWRAERRWQRYAAEARGRGVKLTIADWTNFTLIPDEENFAELPLWQDLRSGRRKLPPLEPARSTTRKERQPGRPEFDLERHRRTLLANKWLTEQEAVGSDAEVILRGLRRVDDVLQGLAQGAARPRGRFTLDWQGGMAMDLLHLMDVMHVQRYLDLKISAELALGRPDIALAHWEAGWALARAAGQDAPTIPILVKQAVVGMLTDRVWNGLDRGVWRDAHLLAIQQRLAEINLLGDMRAAHGAERAVLNGEIEKWMKSRDLETPQRLFGGAKPPKFLLWAYSRQDRWWRNNQLWLNQAADEESASWDPVNERWSPPAFRQFDTDDLHADWFGTDLYLALMCSAAYNSRSFVVSHVYVRLAGLGCALERCRLATGAYPERLEELVPKFIAKLPHEPTNSESFRYRRDEKEGYLLYSIGLNGTDDQGGVGIKEQSDWAPWDWPDWRWWAPTLNKQP